MYAVDSGNAWCIYPLCNPPVWSIYPHSIIPADYKSRGEKLLYGVSPLKETFHDYIFFGGEEEDGHLRSLPHLLAKAEAGAIGQGAAAVSA